MKQTKILMGMPITVEIVDTVDGTLLQGVFAYFADVDKRYSTYKETSEISKINRGLPKDAWSSEMKLVLDLCEQTKKQTGGYFNIAHNGRYDPSGLVKGWAIQNAAAQLHDKGLRNFYIEAGGDIYASGKNAQDKPWIIGIRNPFNTAEIIKVVQASDQGVATSGTYVRGEHIYNPHEKHQQPSQVHSLTVVAPTIYDADRFATAAFAMGPSGIAFLEGLPGVEAYMVDERRIATLTSGFEQYVATNS